MLLELYENTLKRKEIFDDGTPWKTPWFPLKYGCACYTFHFSGWPQVILSTTLSKPMNFYFVASQILFKQANLHFVCVIFSTLLYSIGSHSLLPFFHCILCIIVLILPPTLYHQMDTVCICVWIIQVRLQGSASRIWCTGHNCTIRNKRIFQIANPFFFPLLSFHLGYPSIINKTKTTLYDHTLINLWPSDRTKIRLTASVERSSLVSGRYATTLCPVGFACIDKPGLNPPFQCWGSIYFCRP